MAFGILKVYKEHHFLQAPFCKRAWEYNDLFETVEQAYSSCWVPEICPPRDQGAL